MYFHVSQLWCYCTRVRARVVHRSRGRLNWLRSDLAQWWRLISRVVSRSQLGPNLHVCTSRVPVSGIKSGWPDCTQLWYADRDPLRGCHASQLEAPSRGSARAMLILSFAHLSPQKASCWWYSVITCVTAVVSFIIFVRCYALIFPALKIYSRCKARERKIILF